ncbi:DUF2922 domain-containing protein [Calorimonas adulescens]|uniref:DUF2922 domain-containing protein n=1 Tax=Calorimonas adulescens TaxID=2606906 RepID=A0A5D8QD81_9THEO|nr:DUF2922 domain-containing protein [Calorimonas adulescens]TZE81308.1 DUF2922 domain-containing protein [Calorimonas adulescens]
MKQLQMSFKNDLGRNFRVNVDDIRDDVSPEEIKDCMDEILASDIFDANGGSIAEIVGAKIVTTDIVDVELPQ